MNKTPALPLLILGLTALLACQDNNDTVTVRVCGDVVVPDQLDTLRITVLDEQRNLRQEGIVELVVCPEDVLRTLPHEVEVNVIPGNAWITVSALHDGAPVGTFERRAQLEDEDLILLGLTQDCLGLTCALGQTCLDGHCVIAPGQTGTSICAGERVPDDADAGADTDPPDADTPDTDTPDTDTPDVEIDAPATDDSPRYCPPE